MKSDSNTPVDVVGVGFGPSNLALAIAIEEHNERTDPSERITASFVEKQERFGWHRGMLLPGTTMQISFLKDLATQRDVCSQYSFLKYLSERGKLIDFINQQSFFPTRLEFHDYLEWAAGKVSSPVTYGAEVSSVGWTGELFEVRVAGSVPVSGRNVVLAGGLRSKVPEGVQLSRRLFHNHRLLEHLRELPPLRHQKLVVVGAGQSAAEVAAYLHESYPGAEIHAVFGKYGYTPADDSPYANRIFDPEAVVDFHQSSNELRAQLLSYHRGTNYSAVDPPLIEELYRREYGERVSGRRRLFVRGASEISSISESESGVNVQVLHRPSQDVDELECDAVVYATGFEPAGIQDLLGPLAGACDVDDQGRPLVDRDYRVTTSGQISGGIYLQGATEHTHGLTSTLLSNLAVRSGELVDSLVAAKRAAQSGTRVDTTAAPPAEGEKNLVYQSL
ncbi:SidA/IucD/PvdA family monooxygenase [Williamsia sp. 1135]|uniref:lysine N(6)-hydroxylase/L-ornithine N(5)-oxygenase family protein n=1 Tax=Williamsia sp. 1135 TaxID=1889262 RepID=UPI000A11F812|nr:SidA/IucD/PvdA family monooxygenase [Williamsia sp. 1135]ORM35320.1 L-lysine 6-monooxygenase [Williamsia sp. 1135]